MVSSLQRRRDKPFFVLESSSENYSSYTWPCAIILANYIAKNLDLTGFKTLELGSGTGLVSMVAEKICGANVTLTDLPEKSWFDNIETSCRHNSILKYKIKPIVWAEQIQEKVSFIFASDTLYNPWFFDKFIYTLYSALSQNDQCYALVTIQDREYINHC
ncbi:hypothetical protein O9G_000180 [Rozella allomycis CSF55]|uniref:Uncharacterized protein n=1 Tax=Rozella allomycis (strain CSF55) TaxID=988480 RepID=A0A075ASL4_ROZAC|nr:hypothetical protein O9G_000180 [Rozella allomycis CSF55]|eukprot:EPZ31701.1 hypothetical protein O9G_000180 [Rozella allomycis CSF55]